MYRIISLSYEEYIADLKAELDNDGFEKAVLKRCDEIMEYAVGSRVFTDIQEDVLEIEKLVEWNRK